MNTNQGLYSLFGSLIGMAATIMLLFDGCVTGVRD